MNFDEKYTDSKKPETSVIVSVVIVAYNNRPYIDQCLRSLAVQTRRCEVLFVDNASSDGSAGEAELLFRNHGLDGKVYRLPENLGCAGGNNFGWRRAAGEFVLFLNCDTVLQPDCIERLAGPLMKDADTGITGAKMLYPDGRTIQHAGGIVHPNGMTNHHGAGEEDHGQYDQPRDVDYVTGAALAIRRSLLEELGGFDEDYFPAYYEEVDLCLRARRRGLRVVIHPQAVLVHHESATLGRDSRALRRLLPKMRIRYLIKNLTLRQLLGWAIPFEVRWMFYEPAARGYRWEQIWYGWLGNLSWIARFVSRRK